jgi:hypothetical protein
MTKKLEQLFNLDEIEKANRKPDPAEINSIKESYKAVSEISSSLPQIKELDSLDEDDLEVLAGKAEQAYDDLMDLGMNVEVRYASRIFEVASSMMKNAIDARTAKIDKKLKSIDLQMKKYKIDKDNNEDPNVLNGDGYVITDRNDLLKKLSQKN